MLETVELVLMKQVVEFSGKIPGGEAEYASASQEPGPVIENIACRCLTGLEVAQPDHALPGDGGTGEKEDATC